jgi:hypothetical protein
MKHLTEIFAEARHHATRAFWNAFAGCNFDPEEISEAPRDVLEHCFTKADAAGWKYLKENGAFQHHEWTFPKEKQDGQPS